jgi:Gpi18-like mannosyltransferase
MYGPFLSNKASALDAIQEIADELAQPSLPATLAAPMAPVTETLHPQQAQEKATIAQIWKEAILPYLGTRLVIFAVGLFATYYIMPLLVHVSPLPDSVAQMAFPQSLWLMWNRFDGGFYVQIAQSNYWPASTLHQQTDWVFYPLYPLLIAGGAKLLGGSNDAYNIAGMLIANIAGIFMMVYLYLLVRKEFNSRIASRAVLYLAVFPTAFFFSAIFTESLLVGFCIACIYYARRQSWWLVGRG